ncbi:MAG TPA: transposase [Coxiellaceae bacterium]|nr:transposase [Coxiellaceae bacterium]
MQYRRVKIPGVTYFFTVNLANRKSALLVEHVDKLKLSFKKVKEKHPFYVRGIVVLPDHLHVLMTLPSEDANYSLRWSLIKSDFSRQLVFNEELSLSRKIKRERGVWQRRFWEHLIRDELGYERHLDYIHYNPVKHGYVARASDWKLSSIHYYINKGVLTADWAADVEL